MGPTKPFAQLDFADVPDAPRLPHGYFATRTVETQLSSRPFGEVKIHVRVHGAGPPLLLIHGFMTSSYSWRYLLAPLGERYTLYIPDLVGAGRSDKPDRSYHPDAVAELIGELMTALGIRGAPLFGNSLGGYLGMRLAMRDAGAMSRLVNLHSPGLPTGRNWALKVASWLVPFRSSLVRRLVWRNPERWVHKNVHYFDESLKSREEHREYATPLAAADGVRAFSRMLFETLDVGAMRDFARRLRALDGKFPVPLQLIYAERDPMVPPVVGDRLRALLPSAEFVRLPNTSHFAHVDTPDLVVGAVLPFLAR